MNARELAGVNCCDRCGGRGWVAPASASSHASKCPHCFGRGRAATLAGVARAIDEHRCTLYRLRDGTTNGRTSVRLLEKLLDLLGR